jgi:hypothetical protein
MKAITLTAPWAWAVAHAGKDVENRKTRCPSLLGERIAIHAGVAPKTDAEYVRHEEDFRSIWKVGGVLPGSGQMGPDYGCIVAVATVIGWVDVADRKLTHGERDAGEAVFHNGLESPWLAGPFGWLLHDVRTLAAPIPARGKQGIWTVAADAEARILAQIGGACAPKEGET